MEMNHQFKNWDNSSKIYFLFFLTKEKKRKIKYQLYGADYFT